MQSRTLKLSGDQLRALDYWLRYVISKCDPHNLYERLHAIYLRDIIAKKLAAKLAFVQAETKLKFDAGQALALQISFLRFDIMDMNDDRVEAYLSRIQQQLPNVPIRQYNNLLAPVLIDEYYDEEE
ncbi:MAG: hypothetical protein D6772_13080 [Bacteroidetes bacterium]|nr:MAG: hypothetical protein D6772_13080 [Bacteroidota bacterium]